MSFAKVLKELIESKPAVSPDSLSVRDLLLRAALEEDLQHFEHRDSGVVSVSVTDLVYCSEKYFMQMKYPELKIAQNHYPMLIMGRVLHRGLQEILTEYLHDFVEVEVPVEKSINIELNGLPQIVRVSGRVDALLKDDTVIEFKTSRADHELPLEHHVLQLRIYMNITGRNRGILFYINPDRIAEYTITKPLDDNELQQLITETLANKKHPRWSWECSYCPYNILCPHKVLQNRRR